MARANLLTLLERAALVNAHRVYGDLRSARVQFKELGFSHVVLIRAPLGLYMRLALIKAPKARFK